MNCQITTAEMVECARTNAAPGHALEAHLAGCQTCRERWDAERALTSHLRVMRIASVPENFEWSKAVLLREFDANRRRDKQVRWMWAMSSAAAVVLCVFTLHNVLVKPAAGPALVEVAKAAVYAPDEYPQEAFAPAEEAGETGFIKVPFALDPTPGETFEVVRKQLDPAELVTMGISVDPGWTGSLQADVLVGQDGMTHAVRLSNDDITEN